MPHNLLPGTIFWVEEYFTSWKDRLNKYFGLLGKRPRDGKVPLQDRNSYRGEKYITPPLNRDSIMMFDRLWIIGGRNNEINPVSFGKH